MNATVHGALAAPLLLLTLAASAVAQVRFEEHAGSHLSTMRFGLPLEVLSMAAGDVDGDGDADLLLAGNGGYCRIGFNAAADLGAARLSATTVDAILR